MAEVQTGTAKGTLYVLWRGSRTGRIRFATTPDPLTTAHGLSWTAPAAVPGAVTGATPAASAIGAHGRGPLLLTYKAPHSVHVRYQLSTAAGWSAPRRVPRDRTAVAPALLGGILATTSPSASGSIFFHIFG
jgi:hypothetical protein